MNDSESDRIASLVAEVRRLRFDVENYAGHTTRIATENERLRAALEEMVEEFGDRDGNVFNQRIAVRRARTALKGKPDA